MRISAYLLLILCDHTLYRLFIIISYGEMQLSDKICAGIIYNDDIDCGWHIMYCPKFHKI
jgi:hypothetical protein